VADYEHRSRSRRAKPFTTKTHEFCPDGLGALGILGFLLVQDAQEENPSEFGNVLQRPGTIRAPHDVADLLDGRVEPLLTVEFLAVDILSCHVSLVGARRAAGLSKLGF
jgi:hypothetical protein